MAAFNLTDLLKLQTFNDDCSCVVSVDNTLIAFEVGRPISQSILGTTEYGAQHEELDIYIADLSKTNSARLLIANSPHSVIQTHSFAPSWSPDGKHLAFILIEYREISDPLKRYEFNHYVAVWSKKTQHITKITKINAVNQDYRKQVFRWLNNSELLVKSAKDKTTQAFDFLVNLTERSLGKIYTARFNTKPTASIYTPQVDLDSATSSTEIEALLEISLFNIDQPNHVLWSVDGTPYEYQFDLLISPSKQSYVAPRPMLKSFRKTGEDYFNTLDLGVIEQAVIKHQVNLAPYQTKLLNVLWSQDSRSIWLWLVNLEEKYTCLGKIDYESGQWEAYTNNLFDYDEYEYSNSLVEAEGYIYFPATLSSDGQAHTFDWFRFDITNKTYLNLSAALAIVPEMLFHCGKGVFLGCTQGQLVSYEFGKQVAQQAVISLGENVTELESSIGYSLPLLKRRYYKSRYIFDPATPIAQCLIQKFTGRSFEYFLTTDTHKFTSLLLPDNSRPLAITNEIANPKILILSTHLAGNDVLAISTQMSQVLACFNTHLKQKQQAKTKFFTAVNEDDRSYCEMIFPVEANTGSDYATVVCIYPSLQYKPHENIYVHNCDMQAIFNPHIFAANGYGVLNLGLPLNSKKIQETGILVELARIIEMALKEATHLGLINPERLFIYGHSWGGYAASGILAYLKIFKACIASAGIYNPLGEYGVFDIALEGESVLSTQSVSLAQLTVSSSLHPWEDPQHYIKSSPLFLVNQINTPMLLLHGEQDFTVRYTQAQQMYTALQLQNKPVKLVAYGGEGHIISSRHNLEHAWDTMIKFLDEYDKLI